MSPVTLTKYDLAFNLKAESWTPFRKPYHSLFSEKEIDTLMRSERAFLPGARTIIFCVFENRFATVGGLAAVARHLPRWIKKSGERIVFITPFHSGNKAVKSAFKAGLFECMFRDMPLRVCDFTSEISCYRDTSDDIPSYHIDLKGHFNAGDDPYSYKDENLLLRDSLAFCAAVPFALNRLGLKQHLVFHLHDWETAAIAVTSKMAVISSILEQARSVLTLHNSFDHGITDAVKREFFGKKLSCATVLQLSIPLLNGPLTTVSSTFAHELRNDPLQRGIYTDHLQAVFSRNPPLGVENGMFGESARPFNSEVIEKASQGKFDSIIARKTANRRKCIDVLEKLDDPRIIGRLTFSKEKDVPMLFMSGRLDLKQKGFDVIFHAIKRFKKGTVKIIFCPSNNTSREKKSLNFFEDIARAHKGDIIIIPFRIPARAYETIIKGSSYYVMPSFYEPFGAATEGLLHNTPVIARGTGGLWMQVAPYGDIYVPPSYRGILQVDNGTGRSTGVLFREEFPDSLAEKQWRLLLQLPPERRTKSDLYKAITDAAFRAMQTALEIYKDKKLYGKIVYNGLNSIGQFSWEKSVQKYRKIYDAASFRGI